jgi:hypothetical protein
MTRASHLLPEAIVARDEPRAKKLMHKNTLGARGVGPRVLLQTSRCQQQSSFCVAQPATYIHTMGLHFDALVSVHGWPTNWITAGLYDFQREFDDLETHAGIINRTFPFPGVLFTTTQPTKNARI